MKKGAFSLSTLLLILLIVACGGNQSALSTSTSYPTKTSHSLTITTTPSPSVTNSATPKPTQESTPTIEPTLLSKIERLEELIDQNPKLKNYYNRNCMIGNTRSCTYGSIISPNQEWVVIFDPFDKTGGYRLVNLDTLIQWQISYLQVTGKGYDTGFLRIEHWSTDGKYLYLSPQVESSGGDFWFWHDDVELIRLDLSSGVWVHTNMGPAHAFSPDDGKIAYRSGNSVVVRKLSSGEEFIFPIPSEYVKFGDFVWSEDSRQIHFVASINEETNSADTIENAFTIYHIALEKPVFSIVLEKDSRLLHPILWVSDHEALLASFYDYSCNADSLDFCDELFLFELTTGNITEYTIP